MVKHFKMKNRRVIEINGLVMKAFGILAKGNVTDLGSTSHNDFISRRPYLDRIMEGLGDFGYDKTLGRFMKSDGSHLVVLPSQRERAGDYADFYEAMYGVRPTIEVRQEIPNRNLRVGASYSDNESPFVEESFY